VSADPFGARAHRRIAAALRGHEFALVHRLELPFEKTIGVVIAPRGSPEPSFRPRRPSYHD
jgi:hypothetical protein